LGGLICGEHCTVQKGEVSRWGELIALAGLMCHRSSPPEVRSADTRRNRSAIYRAVRLPANSRADPPQLRLGAGLRAGQAGQAQVRGAKITDSIITGRPGSTA